MKVGVTRDGDAHVLIVSGDVDLETSPELWAQLRQELRRGPVVVDLSAVSYIDSSGVAVLIQGLKLAQKNKEKFTLRHPSSRVMAVLDLAQLPKLFDIQDRESGS